MKDVIFFMENVKTEENSALLDRIKNVIFIMQEFRGVGKAALQILNATFRKFTMTQNVSSHLLIF